MEVNCPRCRKRVLYEGNPFRPFCSERCRLIDLGEWIEERYAIPGEDSGESKSNSVPDDKEPPPS